jgi:hypothetical protein
MMQRTQVERRGQEWFDFRQHPGSRHHGTPGRDHHPVNVVAQAREVRLS